MPVLNTSEELIAAIAKNPFSADPLGDLERQGLSLSPELLKQQKAALAGRTVAAPPAGLPPGKLKGALTFQKKPLVAPLAPPAPGNYDIVCGLTTAAADIALDAVYQSTTIPHQIALDQLLSQGDLTALGGFFKVDRPGGTLSRLHITSAPTLAGTVDGSSIVALRIPIQLDWVRVILEPIHQIRQVVTTAIGTLQLTMRLVANVALRPDPANSTMTIAVQLVTDESSAADSPRLTLDPTSPVQLVSPAPPDKIDGTAVLIQNALSLFLKNDLSFAVSPVINLPIGGLSIAHADVVSKGGVLLAGLQVAGTGTSGATNPAALSSLLPDSTSNLFIRIQDSVANAVIQEALHNGQLTAAAKVDHSNAVVDSASASFSNNAFVAQVKGRLVDECPLSVDLAFISTRTVSIKLEGGSLEIDQSNDNSIADSHNLWCLLTSLGLIGLAVLAGGIFGGGIGIAIGGIAGFILTGVGPFLAGQLIDGLLGGGGPGSTIVDITQPIPGSDFLPTLSGGVFKISDGALLIAATAATRPDDVNTILYVRFLVPGDGIAVTSTKALTGVRVELMDQDAPPPTGDDASTVAPPNTSGGHGRTATSTTHSFQPPNSDQVLAQGQTDLDGIVRFALLKDQLATTAGRIKTVTQRFDPDADRTTTTTSFQPVPEAKPDLYFRVTMPDNSVKDTRGLPGGLRVNFTSARLGTLANPLTFGFGTTTVVTNA